jgi:predicted nucleotidyltransferase
MVSKETRAELLEILTDEALVDLLPLHMARSYQAENALSYIDTLLNQFKAGLAP